jgi:hypothetical protein
MLATDAHVARLLMLDGSLGLAPRVIESISRCWTRCIDPTRLLVEQVPGRAGRGRPRLCPRARPIVREDPVRSSSAILNPPRPGHWPERRRRRRPPRSGRRRRQGLRVRASFRTGRSWASSDRTAPARPRCSTSSVGCSGRGWRHSPDGDDISRSAPHHHATGRDGRSRRRAPSSASRVRMKRARRRVSRPARQRRAPGPRQLADVAGVPARRLSAAKRSCRLAMAWPSAPPLLVDEILGGLSPSRAGRRTTDDRASTASRSP